MVQPLTNKKMNAATVKSTPNKKMTPPPDDQSDPCLPLISDSAKYFDHTGIFDSDNGEHSVNPRSDGRHALGRLGRQCAKATPTMTGILF